MAATRIDRGSTETTTIYSDGTELVFERIFDAPRDQVWKAFTDPEIVPDGRKTRRVSARQDEARAASGIEPGDFRGDGGSGADDQHPGVGVSSH